MLDRYTVASSGADTFQVDTRVTNAAGEMRAGWFAVNVFRSGQHVGTAYGFANDVEPGGSRCVRLTSRDTFLPGPYNPIDFLASP